MASTPDLRESQAAAGIDLLRGFAALMVFIGHGVEVTLNATLIHGDEPPSASVQLLLSTLGSGGYWVWGFFIISGLCIHQSISRSHARGSFSWQEYSAARLSRIYPMYLIGLAFALIAALLIALRLGRSWQFPQAEFFGNLLMTQYYTKPVPFFGPSWSLTCEMLYYFLWPLLLVLARWQVMKALALGLLLSAGSALLLFPAGSDITASIGVYGLIWLAGAGLAVHWEKLSAAVTRPFWHLGWLLLILGWAVVSWSTRAGLAFEPSAWLTLSSIPGWVIVLAGARHFQITPGSRMARWAVWAGLFSYPCYILHRPLLALCSAMLPTAMFQDSWLGAGVRFIAAMLPGLTFIGLIGVRWESALMHWRRGWLKRFHHA